MVPGRRRRKVTTSGECMSSNTREKVKEREMFGRKHEAKKRGAVKLQTLDKERAALTAS